MVRQTIKILAASMLFLTSCYYDVEEVLYPPTTCVTDNLSYVTDINPIIQANCFTCHSAAANMGNITLEGYGNLIKQVNNGQLLGAIKHQAGYVAMPQGAAQLGNCEIAKIEQWVTSGAQNN